MADENDRRLTANQLFPTSKIFVKNFIGGVAWGVGSVIGATIVVALVVIVVRSLNFVPVIGDWISGAVEVVEQNQVQSLKKPAPSPNN